MGPAAEARPARKLRSKVKAEETERAEDAADGVGGAGAGAGTGAGTGAGAESAFAGLLAPALLTLALPRDEALSDLRHIYREWKAVARRWGSFAAAALVPARVERQRLLVGGEAFVKGDAVAVFSELTRQEFPGVVFAVAPTEAIIRLSDGTRCRVQLQHLRNGRVAIYKYAPPPLGGGGGGDNPNPPAQNGGGGGGGLGLGLDLPQPQPRRKVPPTATSKERKWRLRPHFLGLSAGG